MKTKFFLLAALLPITALAQTSDMWKSMEADSRAASVRNQLIINDQNRRQDSAKTDYSSPVARPSRVLYVPTPTGVSVEKYQALEAKYNAMLLRSQGLECSNKQALFDALVEASQARVAASFPDYADENHPIHAAADKIYTEYQKANSPVILQSDCPWIVYSAAAKQLGINPVVP